MYRIYYDGGQVYCNEEGGTPPGRGVEVILQDNRWVGVELVTGADYYIWRDGMWFGADIFGLFDYLLEGPGAHVLFGRTISKEEYNAIWLRVKDEKAGWLPTEVRPDD